MRLFILGFVSLLFTGSIWASRFDFRDLAQRNLIVVNSEALFERTVAISHFVSGWAEVNPSAPDSLTGEFELDVRTLDSGLELKNLQIRDQLLGSSEFPLAKGSFHLPLASQKIKLIEGKPAIFKGEVLLKIKNISKSIPVNFKVTYFKQSEETQQRLSGNLLKVSVTGDLELAAFGILIPGKFSSLLAKTVQVSLDMLGSDRLPDNALSLPEGVKKK
jgi:YceI-like domain